MDTTDILRIAAQYRQQRERAQTQRILTTRQPSPAFPAGVFRMQDRDRQSMARIVLTGITRKPQRR